MAFDFNAVFNEMLDAAENSLKTDVKNAGAQARELLANHRDKNNLLNIAYKEN